MKFCSSCGAPVKENDKFCYACGALLTGGEKGKQPETSVTEYSQPAAGGQTQYDQSVHIDYFDEPIQNTVQAPVVNGIPMGKSPLPVNKAGIIGFVFSVVSFIFLAALFISALVFIANHPELFKNPTINVEDPAFISFAIGVFFCAILGGAFAIAGVCVSGVGISRMRRSRLYGFAIAGLVISCIVLLIFLLMFLSGV